MILPNQDSSSLAARHRLRFRRAGIVVLICTLLLMIAALTLSCNHENDPGTPPDDPLDVYDPAELAERFNLLLDRLCESLETGITPPSLSGIPEEIAFSLERLSGGEGQDFPEYLYYGNGMTLVCLRSSEDENDPLVRVLTKTYPDGTVTITSVDGSLHSVSTLPSQESNSSVTDFSLPSLDVEEIFRALTLRESDLIPEGSSATYIISSDVFRRLMIACGVEQEEAEALCDTAVLTLDISRYAQEKEITFRLSDNSGEGDTPAERQEMAVLTLDFSAFEPSSGTGTIGITLHLTDPEDEENSADGTATLIFTNEGWELTLLLSDNDISVSLHCRITDGEKPGMFLNVSVRDSEDTERLTLDMSMSMSDDSTTDGTLRLQYNISSSDDQTQLPFTLPETGDLSANFSITPSEEDGGARAVSGTWEWTSPEMTAEGSIDIDRDAFQTINARAVEFQMSMTKQDSAPTSMALTLTTQTTDSFLLSLNMLAEEGEQNIECLLSFPADAPALSEDEKSKLDDADRIYLNIDHVNETCSALNQDAIEWVSRHGSPQTTTCYTIKDGVYYFTFFTQQEGSILVTTSAAIPSATDLYLSARYTSSLSQCLPSPMETDAEAIQSDFIATYPEGYSRVYNDARVSACRYIPEIGQYLIVPVNEGGGQILLTSQDPDTMMAGDRYVHNLDRKNPDGTPECHHLIKSWRDDCTAVLTCEDCGMVFHSHEPEHIGIPVAVPTESGSHAEFLECTRCHTMTLSIHYDSSATVTVKLEKWNENAQENMSLESNVKDALIAQDPANALCIVDMDIQGDQTLKQTVIPSLTEPTGYTIVAIRNRGMKGGGNFGTLVLPEGIRYLLHGALSGYCLTGVVLPSSTVYIGNGAFASTSIRELSVPAGVQHLLNAFAGMNDLTDLTLYCRDIEILNYPSDKELHLTLAPGTRIGTLVGNSEYPVTTLVIPDGVCRVEGFGDNPYLEKVILPDSVTAIGDQAFSNCQALREVVFGSHLQSIGQCAFEYCSALQSLHAADDPATDTICLPNSLTEIGGYAFQLCASLQKVRIEAKLTSIPNGLFAYCEELTEASLPDSLTEIRHGAFTNCRKLRLRLPSGLTTIHDRAFQGCESLTDEDIVFSESLVSIGELAFSDCTALRNLVFPASLTDLSDRWPFQGCTLETVVFRNPVIRDVRLGAVPKKITYEGTIAAKIQLAPHTEILTTQLPAESPHLWNTVSYPVTVYFAGTREVWDAARYRLTQDSTLICDYDFSSEDPS